MIKNLEKTKNKLYHFENDKKVDGANKDMNGNCTGLRGDCTGLSGSCTGIIGDLDTCEITTQEREKGIDIMNLVKV